MGTPGFDRVQVRVPSKVNLFLAVRGLRADGYHDLVTVLQTVSIHDTVVAELDRHGLGAHPAARRFMELDFSIEGLAEVPVDDRNLAVRAARCLMRHVGIGSAAGGRSTIPGTPPPPHGAGTTAADRVGGPVTRLRLTKHIPVAAGMAGGSADAAAALLALNHLWQIDLDRDQLRLLAAELGADVPFCVGGGTALATGTGTTTAQVLTRGIYHWVVGITRTPLATPQVYRTFDEIAGPSRVEPDAVLQALRTGDAEALGAALYNDLEAAAFHLLPELIDKRLAMLEAGALGAIVSGSGPTLVALAASGQDALRIAGEVATEFDRVEIALSPAGGPEVAPE